MREKLTVLISAARKTRSARGQQSLMRETLQVSDSENEGDPAAPRDKRFENPVLSVSFEGVPIRILNQMRPVCIEYSKKAIDALVEAGICTVPGLLAISPEEALRLRLEVAENPSLYARSVHIWSPASFRRSK